MSNQPETPLETYHDVSLNWFERQNLEQALTSQFGRQRDEAIRMSTGMIEFLAEEGQRDPRGERETALLFHLRVDLAQCKKTCDLLDKIHPPHWPGGHHISGTEWYEWLRREYDDAVRRTMEECDMMVEDFDAFIERVHARELSKKSSENGL